MTEPVTRPSLEGTGAIDPVAVELHVECAAGQCTCPTFDHNFGCSISLAALVEHFRTELAQAPALAAENQKLREALGAAVDALKAVDRIGHHVYTNADNEFAPMHWADADKLVHAALASAAPLLEGEGASK